MEHIESRAVPFWNHYTIGVLLLASFMLSWVAIELQTDRTGFSQLALLMVIQSVPFLVALTTRRLNFLALVMANHLLTYSIAKLNQFFNIYKLTEVAPVTRQAISELTLCSILLIVSYYCASAFILRRRGTAAHRPLFLSRRALHAVGLMSAMHTFLTAVLPNAVHSIEIVLYFISLVILFSSRSTGNERLLLLYKTLAVAAGFHHFLRTGMLVYFGTVGGVIFIVLCLEQKRKSLVAVGVIALSLITLQPVKGWYRNLIKNNPSAGFVEKIDTLGALLSWKYFGSEISEETAELAGIAIEEAAAEESEGDPEGEEGKDILARGFARIGDDSLERVLAWTPEKVPFWNGESYANIPFMFIPRFLWPDKPRWTFWNQFGRTYGILSSDDYSTSVAIGYLGEAYMNFGHLGMYTCAMFVGLLLVMVEWLSLNFFRGAYSFSFACFLATIVSFAQSLGAILNSIVLMSGILFLLRPFLMRYRTREGTA